MNPPILNWSHLQGHLERFALQIHQPNPSLRALRTRQPMHQVRRLQTHLPNCPI